MLEEFHGAGKPQALCCIAPVIAAKVQYKIVKFAGCALSAFHLSNVLALKVLGSKGVSLTLGNQGNEADWPYQGAIEAAKVNFVGRQNRFYWSHPYRSLEPIWS